MAKFIFSFSSNVLIYCEINFCTFQKISYKTAKIHSIYHIFDIF